MAFCNDINTEELSFPCDQLRLGHLVLASTAQSALFSAKLGIAFFKMHAQNSLAGW